MLIFENTILTDKYPWVLLLEIAFMSLKKRRGIRGIRLIELGKVEIFTKKHMLEVILEQNRTNFDQKIWIMTIGNE